MSSLTKFIDFPNLSPRSQFAKSFGEGMSNSFTERMKQLQEQEKQQQKLKSAMEAFGISPQTTANRFDPNAASQDVAGSDLSQAELAKRRLGVASAMGDDTMVRALTPIYKEEARREATQEQRNYESSKTALDEAAKHKQSMGARRLSLQTARQAIANGDVDSFRNWLAEATGVEAYKTASGAALSGAAKQHLLASAQGVSAKGLTKFLEQKIDQAFAAPGGSKEANLAKIELLDAYADMEDLVDDTILDLAEQYESKGQAIPGNIKRAALKKAQPEIEKRLKITAYRMQDYMEPQEGDPRLEILEDVEPGTPLTQKKANAIIRKVYPGKTIETLTDDERKNLAQGAKKYGYDLSYAELIE